VAEDVSRRKCGEDVAAATGSASPAQTLYEELEKYGS